MRTKDWRVRFLRVIGILVMVFCGLFAFEILNITGLPVINGSITQKTILINGTPFITPDRGLPTPEQNGGSTSTPASNCTLLDWTEDFMNTNRVAELSETVSILTWQSNNQWKSDREECFQINGLPEGARYVPFMGYQAEWLFIKGETTISLLRHSYSTRDGVLYQKQDKSVHGGYKYEVTIGNFVSVAPVVPPPLERATPWVQEKG